MPTVVSNKKAAFHSISLVMEMATEKSPSAIEVIVLKPGNTVVQDRHFDVLVKTPVFIERRTRGVYIVIEKDVKDSSDSDLKNSDGYLPSSSNNLA